MTIQQAYYAAKMALWLYRHKADIAETANWHPRNRALWLARISGKPVSFVHDALYQEATKGGAK